MRILRATVSSFGSYDYLEFEFDGQGLVLVAGPTGAGKSTLFDIIPWTLFGITSKNGAVDDIRMWGSKETTGRIEIETGIGRVIEVNRVRGSSNDLYYRINHSNPARGKDLLDTQRGINHWLGITPELYLAGAYFHEFSQTTSFFTAAAKVRRAITEQLVDLALPKKLTDKIAEAKKDVKGRSAEADKLLIEARTQLDGTTRHLNDAQLREKDWSQYQIGRYHKLEAQLNSFDDNKAKRIEELQDAALEFEEQKAVNVAHLEADREELQNKLVDEYALHTQLEEVTAQRKGLSDEICSHCGAKKDSHLRIGLLQKENELRATKTEQVNNKRALASVLTLVKREKDKENPYLDQIKAEEKRENTYVNQLKQLLAEVNPHSDLVARLTTEQEEQTQDLKTLQEIRDLMKVEASDLDTLGDVNDQFRGALIKRAVKDLEVKTNDLLTRHFDAELRVEFDIASADKLEVAITKDGNACSYAQLSKGQRQLLKLCFGVSVMKVVAQHHAVDFQTIFLDEFADGCDEERKAQAYGLLQELSQSYSSVFAIDHSEGLKAMFEKRVDVRLEDGRSVIEQA